MSFFAIIALVFAAWMILIGVPLLLNSKDIHAMLDSLGKKPSGALLSLSFVTVAVSVIILGTEHRLMADNWMWVVPLLGWIGLVKGAFIILFPNSVRFMVTKVYNPGTTSMLFGLIASLLGVFFLWLAFNVY
ncbi:hypothetical protein JXA59_00655 [Patescibacteria group bacterium]|nr:hypothetical protein [Patescibacteria group bacterium]